MEYIRQTAYKELRRYGYLKTSKDNPTGFISEEEEAERRTCEEEGKHRDELAWFKDFNRKMLMAAIKIRE